MIRVLGFLLLVGLAALGAAALADLGGDLVLTVGTWRVQTSLPVAALGLGLVVVAILFVWSLLRGLWRTPKALRTRRREKRRAKAHHAITHGLIAIGHGDALAARGHAATAQKLAGDEPLALLLEAQSAQLSGDRDSAARAFRSMAERQDTRLLGLRGLFIEAQRADDPHAAIEIAEEALRTSPGVGWASQAVLGLRCAQGDWSGALQILERDAEAGLLDRKTFRRHRAVLLTARAIDTETSDRDLSRDSVMEANRLAPTLVPAAVLAAKFQSEAHQIRRAMRLVETAWSAQPHPDLADAYAHVRLGDSAQARLARVETLAAKAPDHLESRLAVARAAIDAQDFGKAREALAPLLTAPTQRVALLMAEIERTEHADAGRARAWMQRAVRALHDPVWTADGYVSDRWRPVSPVTGRLDAFHWQTPVAALPGDRAMEIGLDEVGRIAPLPEPLPLPAATPEVTIVEPEGDSPEPVEASAPAVVEEATQTPPPAPAPPLFRERKDGQAPSHATPRAAPIIPIVRAPDDPGVEDGDRLDPDEFSDALTGGARQPGGVQGFIRRWGG
jgi:HemY protein